MIRDLLDLLRMGATSLAPRCIARRRMHAAWRGHKPQLAWGAAYHATKLLRNAALAGR